MEKHLVRKIALVTGASSGIGAATVRRLVDNGARVCINFLKSKNDAIQLEKELNFERGEVIIFGADVSRRDQVNKMLEFIEDRWGSVDILINNAAPQPKRKLLEGLTWEDILEELNIHCRGALNTMQAVLPKMKEKKRGQIINVLSSYILVAPPRQMAAYVVAKEALFGLSKVAAVEFGQFGVSVNMVSPAPTDTRMFSDLPFRVKELIGIQNSLRRFLKPEEVAEQIVSLLTTDIYKSGVNLTIGF